MLDDWTLWLDKKAKEIEQCAASRNEEQKEKVHIFNYHFFFWVALGLTSLSLASPHDWDKPIKHY